MAARRQAVTAGGTKARKVEARPEPKVVKTKVDPLKGLADSIRGKDEQMEVLPLSDDRVVGHIKKVCSTRSIALDKATRIGGFPFGRMVEIYGGEGTGKTTLTDHIAVQVQSMGGVVAVLDSEEKKDRRYAKALGVDLNKLLMIQPEKKTVEAAIAASSKALDYWVEQGLHGTPMALIWDSLAGLPTMEELENPATKQPGMAAREVRRAMRVLISKIARSEALFLITNQQYEKIGFTGGGPGVKRSTYGGGGPRYASTMRVELIRTGTLKDGKGNGVGIEVLAKMMKNHAGLVVDAESSAAIDLEVREEPLAIRWGHGINNAWSIMEKLKECRYITGSGGHWKFQVAGKEPVTWQGGWQGLTDLLASKSDLFTEMATIFMGLP